MLEYTKYILNKNVFVTVYIHDVHIYIYMFFPCLCIHVYTYMHIYIYRYIHMCSHMCVYRSQYLYIFIFRPVKVSQKVIYIYIIMKVWCCFLSLGLFSSKTLVNLTYTCISDRFLYVYIHICVYIHVKQKSDIFMYIETILYKSLYKFIDVHVYIYITICTSLCIYICVTCQKWSYQNKCLPDLSNSAVTIYILYSSIKFDFTYCFLITKITKLTHLLKMF